MDVTNQTIQINTESLLNKHPLAIAETIIHEAMHAYINVKKVECDTTNSSTLIEDLNQLTLDELLNDFSINCNQNQPEAHRLMYNTMVNVMIDMLSDVFNSLVHQDDLDPIQNFYLPPNGTLHEFTWDNALDYLVLAGLTKTEEYIEDLEQFPERAYLVPQYNQRISSGVFNHNACHE